jgi:hypothetical protein
MLAPRLVRTAQRLEQLQHTDDGRGFVRGEFPVTLRGESTSRVDHNFLSGYALLHVAAALRSPALPDAARIALDAVLATAVDVPRSYQSDAGTCNWYSGRDTGLPCPADYAWEDADMLCLHDDYDDTAIAALLTVLGDCCLRIPPTAELFARAPYDPRRDRLVPKSVRRARLAGAGAGVYQSWALRTRPRDRSRRLVWLPTENSVELTTVANVYTAVHALGGAADAPAQRASRAFVNGLARVATERLLTGDASYLDFASSYYPRFPFAPLTFLVRDHVLTEHSLLDDAVAALIARAVRDVDPATAWRMRGFGTHAFWLNCCAWCLSAGLLSAPEVAPLVRRVLADLPHADLPHGEWSDIVFFHGAHLGDYSGTAYSSALMVETLALLYEAGFS